MPMFTRKRTGGGRGSQRRGGGGRPKVLGSQRHAWRSPVAIVTAGAMRTEVTALVVRLPGGQVIRLGNPAISPVWTATNDKTWRLAGRGFGWRIEIGRASCRERV